MNNAKGFTLIELSIVMVITGFIVGGVLVGRDLIAHTLIRTQIVQLEKFRTAVQTFQVKYAGIPGDLGVADATKYNFNVNGMNGTDGYRNGDGLLRDCSLPTAADMPNCGETALFWQDLALAKLIDGMPVTSQSINYAFGGSPALTQTAINLFAPKAKIDSNSYIIAFSPSVFFGSSACDGTFFPNGCSVNDFQILADRGGVPSASMTGQQAYLLDLKIDDGFPLSGKVYAYFYLLGNVWSLGTLNMVTTGTTASNSCGYTSNGVQIYNQSSTVPACIPTINF